MTTTTKKPKWLLYRHKITNEYSTGDTYHFNQSEYESVPNDIVFRAVLCLKSTYGKGDAGWGFYMRNNTTNETYKMFGSDAENMLKHCVMENGTVAGKWCFRKSGSSLGIQYLGKEETETNG